MGPYAAAAQTLSIRAFDDLFVDGLGEEGDLPTRELDARRDQQWQRIETLSKIRSRVGLEIGALEATMNSLDDPEVAPPDPIVLRKRLESLERLVGAIRVEP